MIPTSNEPSETSGLFWRWFGPCSVQTSTDERSHIGYCDAAESGFGWSSPDPPPWRGNGGALYAVLILHRCTIGLFWAVVLAVVWPVLNTDERSHIGNCDAAESGFGWSSPDPPPWRGDGGALYAVLILHRCTPPGPSATCLSAMDGGVSSRGLTCSSVSAVARYGKLGAGVLYTPSGHEACAWAAAQSQQGNDA